MPRQSTLLWMRWLKMITLFTILLFYFNLFQSLKLDFIFFIHFLMLFQNFNLPFFILSIENDVHIQKCHWLLTQTLSLLTSKCLPTLQAINVYRTCLIDLIFRFQVDSHKTINNSARMWKKGFCLQRSLYTFFHFYCFLLSIYW